MRTGKEGKGENIAESTHPYFSHQLAFCKDLVPLTKMRCQNTTSGASLVVQWLRLRAPIAGGPGSIPGQGTSSHMTQLRVSMP